MKFAEVKGQATDKLEHFRYLEENGKKIKRIYEGHEFRDQLVLGLDFPEFDDIIY